MNEEKKTEEIFDLVVNTTLNAIRNFAQNRGEAEFQILDIIMPKERTIRSIVGGLETSLGTTLWEPLAKGLANSNGFEVFNGRDIRKPINMPVGLEDTLNRIISSRENPNSHYDAESSREEIKKACALLMSNPILLDGFCRPPRGDGVDVWIRKDGIDYLFDSKTVQPNIGTYKKSLRQIMTWYAYYYSRFPSGQAKGFIFIPYNPYTNEDFFVKTMGHGFPLLKEELWVENTLWDFCSGVDDTYKIIYSAFEYIRDNQLVKEVLDRLFGNGH